METREPILRVLTKNNQVHIRVKLGARVTDLGTLFTRHVHVHFMSYFTAAGPGAKPIYHLPPLSASSRARLVKPRAGFLSKPRLPTPVPTCVTEEVLPSAASGPEVSERFGDFETETAASSASYIEPPDGTSDQSEEDEESVVSSGSCSTARFKNHNPAHGPLPYAGDRQRILSYRKKLSKCWTGLTYLIQVVLCSFSWTYLDLLDRRLKREVRAGRGDAQAVKEDLISKRTAELVKAIARKK